MNGSQFKDRLPFSSLKLLQKPVDVFIYPNLIVFPSLVDSFLNKRVIIVYASFSLLLKLKVKMTCWIVSNKSIAYLWLCISSLIKVESDGSTSFVKEVEIL